MIVMWVEGRDMHDSIPDGSFILRRFQPGDDAAIMDLHERALRQVGAYLPGPWNDDLLDIPSAYLHNGGEFLVGTLDDRIVAMGAFRRTDAERAEIKRMRVDPACQGRGYGRMILLALEERARQMGYEVLHLDTSTNQPVAVHLYQRHGYIQVGTKPFQDLQLLFFEKRI